MKPIQCKKNLQVAEKVRRAVNRLNTSTMLMNNSHYECFDNCREQGYVLQVNSKFTWKTLHVAFSECRNTDQIVVYAYHNARFPSNLPASDADWQNAHYFQWDKVDDAAKFILKVAEDFLKDQFPKT